ncbi:alpha/beta fold hydrolase [Candidatus Nitrospira bockiana]
MHARVGGASAESRWTAVVLLHGLVISSRYMVPTAERLAAYGRVYAVDLPGYGLSEKPRRVLSLAELSKALASWLDAERLDRPHFVGNSFGCQILADFSVRYPERVDRLVFQGPTMDPRARSFWMQMSRVAQNSRRESPGLGWITLQDYWRAGLRRIIGTIRIALDDRIEEKLPAIRAPVLVVRGDRDPVVPQEWAEEIAARLPNGRLAVIPGAAHTINYTKPGPFVDVIRPFLEG